MDYTEKDVQALSYGISVNLHQVEFCFRGTGNSTVIKTEHFL